MSIEVEVSKPEAAHVQITVLVIAPREPDPRPFQFPHAELTGDAARTAAAAFGYTGGNPTFSNAQHTVLDRTKSLAAEHVHDGDTLHLVDVGGGV